MFDAGFWAILLQVLLHKLALLRDQEKPPREFRRLLHECTLHIGCGLPAPFNELERAQKEAVSQCFFDFAPLIRPLEN